MDWSTLMVCLVWKNFSMKSRISPELLWLVGGCKGLPGLDSERSVSDRGCGGVVDSTGQSQGLEKVIWKLAELLLLELELPMTVTIAIKS